MTVQKMTEITEKQTQKQKQKKILLKTAITYFQPGVNLTWFTDFGYFNFSEIPDKIEYDNLLTSISGFNDNDKSLFNSMIINNINCVSKRFLTNLNEDTVNYIKEYIQIDLTMIYKIFKMYWLKEYLDIFNHRETYLKNKANRLEFNTREYQNVNYALKMVRRDRKKLEKNKMFF